MQRRKSFFRKLSRTDWGTMTLPPWLSISAISWRLTQSCLGWRILSLENKLMQLPEICLMTKPLVQMGLTMSLSRGAGNLLKKTYRLFVLLFKKVQLTFKA